jgi:hypothetical protein
VPELLDILAGRAGSNLLSFLRLTRSELEKEPADHTAARDGLLNALALGYDELETLLQQMLNVGDIPRFLDLDRAWQQISDDPAPWEPEDDEDTARSMLARRRAVARLALAMWAMHRVAGASDPTQRSGLSTALQAMANQFGSANAVLQVLEWSLAEDQAPHSKWTSWYLGELPVTPYVPAGRIIPTQEDLLRAALLIGALKVDAGESLDVHSWMRFRRDDVIRIINQLMQESSLWANLIPSAYIASNEGAGLPAVPAAQFGQQLEMLRQALERTMDAVAAADDAASRGARRSEAKVDELIDGIVQRYSGARPVRPIIERRGEVQSRTGPPEESGQELEVLVSKDLLSEDGQEVLGLDFIAADIARELAIWELQWFLAAVPSTAVTTVPAPVGPVIREALHEAGARALRIDLIVGPIGWEFRRQAQLEPLTDEEREQFGQAPIPGVTGRIEDALVLATPLVKDEILLLDTARAIRWEEWPSPGNGIADVQVEFLDADRIRLMTRDSSAGTSAADIEARHELEAQALVRISPRFRVTPRDATGVIRLRLDFAD